MRHTRLVLIAGLILLTADTRALGAQAWLAGFRVGYGGATQRDEYGTGRRVAAATIGPSVTRELSSWAALQGELLYADKGLGHDAGWIMLRYVEAPVLLRLALPTSEVATRTQIGVRPFIAGGVAPGLRLGCQESVPRGQEPNSGTVGQVIRERPTACGHYTSSALDLAVVYEGGILLRLRSTELTAELRRTLGTRDLQNHAGNHHPRNDVTSVLIGASFQP